MINLLLKDKLTIVLTLKDRSEFTFRWLDYAKKRDFPFTILIADGGADDAVGKHIDEGAFEALNIRYIKFDEDVDYETFYNKVKKSLELVDTPYYITADNDDFYSLAGLTEAVNYLEDNADYVACGGKLVPFSNENGKVYSSRVRFYSSNHDNYFESEPRKRLIKYFSGAPGPFYSVIKTKIAREVWKKICSRNFKDIRMFELLIDTFVITSGKVHNLDCPFYFRQIGKNIGNEFGLSHNFFDEVFAPTWSSEINYIADCVVEKCDDKKFSHEEFWFYLKRYLLPRVLNGIMLDVQDRNNQKLRRILLGKVLRSGKVLMLLRELLFSRRKNGLDKSNDDVKFILEFLGSGY